MKKKRLYILLACLLLVLVAGVVGVVVLVNQDKPVTDATGVKLYWNIDRDEYVGDSSAGMNSRERAEDGFYKVRFAVDGEQVEYNVEKARLVHEIDSMDIMGLAINDEGVITKVYNPEDITGGEVASMYYVVFGSDTTLTVSSDEALEEDYKMLAVTENTGVYNVTGMDPVGYVDSAVTSDRIRAFQNDEGEITHVFIIERYGYWAGETVTKYCEHCKEEVEWRVWEQKYALPIDSAHWVLENNVKLSAQHKITENKEIILDLNGKTVKGPDSRRVYAMTGENSFLAILDSSTEGTGKIVGSGSPDNGGLVYVRYGTFELYGGTLDASAIETLQYGSAVRINTNCVFNMYGGEIIGGTALGSMDEEEKSTKGGYGGTIQVAGTFNMYDGVIRDGKALRYEKKDGTYTCGNGGNLHLGTNAVFNMYGGEILNGTAQRAGGNIYMAKNVVVNISGGTISGGVVMDDDRYGGNIYVNNNAQAFNMTGGTIKDGKTLGAGGNIALYATMNMSGGTITGGSCMTGKTLAEGVHNEEYPHHNIYCVGGTLNMSGGLVEGYVRIRDTSNKTCTVNLSGTAQIKGGSINLSLDPGDDVNIGTLEKGADIRINGGGYVSTKTAKANTTYVRSTYEGVETQYINNKIFIGKQACVCGETEKHIGDCDGTLLDWIPWGTPTTMPNVEANWYLVCDVTMDDQVKIAENATFRLDLNGHTVTGAKDMRVYALRNGGINLMITDHSADNSGVIIAQGENMGRGAVIWVSDNGSLKMYGGTLDGSKATGVYSGTTVTVDANCAFTLYAGTVKGGNSVYLVTTKDGKETKQNGYGGAIYVSGILDMYDGLITGGVCAESGGNVFVGKTGVLNLYGGEVTGGTAGKKGGNIAGTGKVNIYASVVSSGSAGTYGGNIFAGNGGKFVLSDDAAVVSGGSAKQGGNIYIENGATISMKAGTMKAGNSSAHGGSAAVYGEFNISGGQISDSNAKEQGGNIFVGKAGSFTFNGGTVLDGTAGTKGGNIAGTGQIRITGGLVSGGEASNGGNISVAGTFNMSGGTVKDGVVNNQNQQDRNIFADQDIEGSTFTISGGTIAGGVRIKSTYGATLTGTANISNELGYLNLTLDDGVTISLGDLTEGAQIGINPKYTTYFATDAVESDIAYFTVDIEGKSTINLEDEDKLILINWQEWTSESASGKLPYKAGYYYLSDNMTVTAATTMNKNETVYLDLNGKTITASNNARVYVLDEGSVLNIADSSEEQTGKIVGNRESTAVAGMIYIKGSGAILNLYQGCLDASAVSVANGSAIYVNEGTVFNMYGGEITGGTATETGGNVYITAGTTAGEFNLLGGTVTAGTAKQGGNVYVAAGSSSKEAAVLNISGGTISNGTGTTTAGNVAALGVFEMTGGEIKGGICNVSGDHKYAANVYTLPGKNKCSFTMTGGTIVGLVRVNNAGTLTVGGTAKIMSGSFTGSKAGTITCGLFVSTTEAEIAVNSAAPLTEGAEICMGSSNMVSGTLIVSGAIEDIYQKYFAMCGSGILEFKNDGIYVAE